MGRHLPTSLVLLAILAGGKAFAESPLKVLPLTMAGDVSTTTFQTEVAVTGPEKEHGLMGRQQMADDAAMLFVFKPPQPVQFWMKDTPLSLDMVFVHADGTVAVIAANTVPNSQDLIGVDDKIAAVIEVKAGTAAHMGLHRGSHVSGPAFEAAK